MNLLERIANYFRDWNGHDEDAPKMELNINELRSIASMNIDRCRAEKQVKYFAEKFVDGKNVLYEGDDESDGIHCPCCTYEVARNDDYKEMRPKHCPECGTKLNY